MSTVGIGARQKEIPVPTQNGRKIAELIREGIKLQIQIGILKGQLEENNKLLIPHAEHLAAMSDQKTVGFKAPTGKVTITFGDLINYAEKDMPKIKKILGPLFDKAFSTLVTYDVNAEDIPDIKKLLGKEYERLIAEQPIYTHTKELRNLLSDGDSKVGEKLRDVIIIEQARPKVKYETVKA